MAERLGTGLQNLLQRFDSAWHLKLNEKTLIECVLLGFLLYLCTKLAPTQIEKALIRKEFGLCALLNHHNLYDGYNKDAHFFRHKQ